MKSNDLKTMTRVYQNLHFFIKYKSVVIVTGQAFDLRFIFLGSFFLISYAHISTIYCIFLCLMKIIDRQLTNNFKEIVFDFLI
jgi:hypothetical protein